jgi:hypothetical protein
MSNLEVWSAEFYFELNFAEVKEQYWVRIFKNRSSSEKTLDNVDNPVPAVIYGISCISYVLF